MNSKGKQQVEQKAKPTTKVVLNSSELDLITSALLDAYKDDDESRRLWSRLWTKKISLWRIEREIEVSQ